jgi:hypothetical protein
MKNEFDKKLTDKGWQSMRRLLDREMPEQRRRRRFAWWPLALLLLPLAGAGGWWFFQPSKPANVIPPPVEAPKVSEPVAVAKDASNSPELPPAVVGVPADNKRRSSILDEKYRTFAMSLTGGVVGEDANNGQKFQTFGKLDALSVIPQFVENEIKNTQRPSTVTPFETTIKKKHAEPKRWSFGLAAGLSSEDFSALNSYSAGAAVDWQFARKWGLRSGFQYSQYNLSEEARPVVSLNSDDYEEATGNDVYDLNPSGNPSTPTSSASSSVYVSIERLQQLEMPLLAYWQPVRPLRIFGGISTAYALSAEASSQSFANNQFYLAADQKAQDNLNDLTSKTLSRWQASWQAGAGIRLGRHFELDVFYKHGFSTGVSNHNFNDLQGINFDPQWQPRKANSHYFLLQGIWFF